MTYTVSSGTLNSTIPYCRVLLTWVLWHCWLGNRKGVWPAGSCMLVCWRWTFDWSFAHLITAVVTTTSIILAPVTSRMLAVWYWLTGVVLEMALKHVIISGTDYILRRRRCFDELVMMCVSVWVSVCNSVCVWVCVCVGVCGLSPNPRCRTFTISNIYPRRQRCLAALFCLTFLVVVTLVF